MNKKLIIAAALCGLALGSRAQTEKGNFLLGGNYSFISKKDAEESPRTNGFTIGPKFGYFTGNNFAIGLDASYFYSNKESWVTYTTGPNGDLSGNLTMDFGSRALTSPLLSVTTLT